MRILVAGATGYVGSRLVPELLARGHEVVSAASSEPDPGRYAWGAEVESVQMDATEYQQVLHAMSGVDAVCYLVHGLSRRDFRSVDRTAATNLRTAAEASDVRRVVYLSGLVPDVPREDLSEHVISRLEVEEVLTGSAVPALALRAGVVLGAGSTSYEIMRQLATVLLVQPVPTWLDSRVQPVAIADVVEALADGLEGDRTGSVDLGGPDVLKYAELLALYCDVAGLRRLQVPALLAPLPLASLAAGLVTAAPYWTAAALVQSLRHDMVCRAEGPFAFDPSLGTTAAEAIRLALRGDLAPYGLEAGDPDWVQKSWFEAAIGAIPLPGATALGTAAHIAEQRLRDLLT